jgi:hypothetical protein
MTIAASIPNLFDRARFGERVTFVDTAEDVASAKPVLLIVDIDRCPDIESFVIPGIRLLGFGPHVDTAGHAHALSVGYHEVLPRSVFFRRLDEILADADGRDS